MLPRLRQFGDVVVEWIRAVEGLTRGNPPMIVCIVCGEAAVSLERLAWQVPAPVAGLATEDRRRIGQEWLGRLFRVRSLEHLREQASGEGELVAFERQSQRLLPAERQRTRKVVAPEQYALQFDQP